MFTLMGPGLDVNVDFIAVWKAAKQAYADRQPWERPTAARERDGRKKRAGAERACRGGTMRFGGTSKAEQGPEGSQGEVRGGDVQHAVAQTDSVTNYLSRSTCRSAGRWA